MFSKCVEHMAGAEVVQVERASGAGGAEASREPWKLENAVGASKVKDLIPAEPKRPKLVLLLPLPPLVVLRKSPRWLWRRLPSSTSPPS